MLLPPASQIAHSKVLGWGLATLSGMNYRTLFTFSIPRSNAATLQPAGKLLSCGLELPLQFA